MTKRAFWLTEPSFSTVEMAKLAGFDAIVLDIEHGLFTIDTQDRIIPFIKALGMGVIAKVFGPNREYIQQALDFGADTIAIPHIESAQHAAEICAYGKFPPLGLRSLAGGRTASFGGFTDEWAHDQNTTTRIFPMIEDAGAFAEINDILALDVVDGIFIGPGDLSMTRGNGAPKLTEAYMSDLETLAIAAKQAGKPFILPAWTLEEQRFALEHGAETAVLTMHYGCIRSGMDAALATFEGLTAEKN